MSLLVIGITGGSGAGKTTMLRCVRARGGVCIDCDALYHDLTKTDNALRAELTEAFGEVFLPNGDLDRTRLGQLVFSDAAQRARLDEITARHVGNAVKQRLAQAEADGVPLAAIDAINLIQSGLGELCRVTVGVLAPEETRLARILTRDGVTRERALARLHAQAPDEFYHKNCGYLLINNADAPAQFALQADALLDQIIKDGSAMTKEQKEKLLYAPKHGYARLSESEKQDMERYCADYRTFLDRSKTERACVKTAIALAQARGFVPYVPGMPLKAGDKVYCNNRDKGIMLAVIGRLPLDQGANIGAAHTDAPRLDLKPNPLYEENAMAYLKTHHYGGIRKYQWVTVPLELHGVVVLADGSRVDVNIGADAGDPQFIINDLLPHLGREQGKKPLDEAIQSETLNILIGSWPEEGEEGSDAVKLAILHLLNEKYGMTEEDFISAELEAVPAANARELGLDRSLIGAYGHDDRVCAYAELAAILELDTPNKTAVCIFADKEEIGSEGVSGMQSEAFDLFMEQLCRTQNVALRDCFAKSFCLSADVTAAYDPNFPDVYERHNSAYINYGVGLCKYTGSGGKSGASDASAEVVGWLRKLLNDSGVHWQMAELGRTGAGGGGTVAKYMANRNIDTLDAGVPVLSMHAPYETVAKLDCYMTYRCMKAIFES